MYGAALEGKPVELFTTRFDSTDSRPLGLEKTQLLAISSRGEIAVTRMRIDSGVSWKWAPWLESLWPGARRGKCWTMWNGRIGLLTVRTSPWPGRSPVLQSSGVSWAAKSIYQPQGWVSHVRFSRNGKLIAFADHVPTGDDGRVVVVDREGKPKVVSRFYSTVEGVAWSRDGSEVWFTASPSGAARALYAMNMAGKERLVLRVPGTLSVQDITPRWPRAADRGHSADHDDGVAARGKERAESFLVRLVPCGRPFPGRQDAHFRRERRGSRRKIRLVSSQDGRVSGGSLGDGAFSAMSPDGKWVASLDLGSPYRLNYCLPEPGSRGQLTNDALEHIRGCLGSGRQRPGFCRQLSPITRHVPTGWT